MIVTRPFIIINLFSYIKIFLKYLQQKRRDKSFALPSSNILVALHTIHLNELVAFHFISGGGSRIF